MRKIVFTLAALAATATANAEGLLNANTASAEELAALPYMDEILAEAVIDGRPYISFSMLDDLLSADLFEEELAELYSVLFVPIDLNAAGPTDILLIPNVGEKVAFQFEGYRPYTSIDQFEREMSKYIDDSEVSRLSQYVTVSSPTTSR